MRRKVHIPRKRSVSILSEFWAQQLKAGDEGTNVVQTQIITRSKERLASEFIWEKRCVEEEEAEEEE